MYGYVMDSQLAIHQRDKQRLDHHSLEIVAMAHNGLHQGVGIMFS